jgi:hypothetical protein
MFIQPAASANAGALGSLHVVIPPVVEKFSSASSTITFAGTRSRLARPVMLLYCSYRSGITRFCQLQSVLRSTESFLETRRMTHLELGRKFPKIKNKKKHLAPSGTTTVHFNIESPLWMMGGDIVEMLVLALHDRGWVWNECSVDFNRAESPRHKNVEHVSCRPQYKKPTVVSRQAHHNLLSQLLKPTADIKQTKLRRIKYSSTRNPITKSTIAHSICRQPKPSQHWFCQYISIS